MDDLISRQAAIDVFEDTVFTKNEIRRRLSELPSAQPERLTDDDFETIRIHLNAQKEELCNQRRWKEAEEYQRIIDRFMAFASAQPERKKGKWEEKTVFDEPGLNQYQSARCSACGLYHTTPYSYYFYNYKYCPYCGAEMSQGEENEGN